MLIRSVVSIPLFAIQLLAYDPRADLEAGRFLRVLSEAEAQLKVSSNSALAWAAKSQALSSMQRFGEALPAAEKSLSLNSGLADAYLARGLARAGSAVQQRNFSSLRNATGAMDDLRAATRLDSKLTRAWIALGLAYEQLPGILGGSTKKALSCADALKRVHSAKGEALAGTIYALDNRWKEAYSCFQRALTHDARDPEVIYAYLDALSSRETRAQLGQVEQKKRLSIEAKRLRPLAKHRARALEGVCDALLDAGEAELAWQIAMEDLPKVDIPSLLRLQMGKLSARAGIHKEEGLALLDQVVREPMEGGSGGYPTAYWRRGQVLQSLGRRAEAIASAREALKWDPKHPGAGRLLKELGA